MKKLLTTLLVSMLLAFAVSGCQENNSPEINPQAKLIANEILRLELDEKNARIAELQSQLEKCEKRNTDLKDQAVKTGKGYMEVFATINQKNGELVKENAALKARIKELEK
ncbi:MAG: hypothetical protein FVQ82_13550 [Planctomycetes bacterium]|nr:hypothetical protein [Planctomycetota bacterium]